MRKMAAAAAEVVHTTMCVYVYITGKCLFCSLLRVCGANIFTSSLFSLSDTITMA